MKRDDALKLLRKTMDKHGLEHVEAKMNSRMTSTFGRYRYSFRTHTESIELSTQLCSINDEDRVMRTILHEIAHALTRGHGHDAVWRAKCIEIGGDGQAQYSASYTNTIERTRRKWRAYCEEHGARGVHYARRRRACGACCHKYNNNRYSSKYELRYEEI